MCRYPVYNWMDAIHYNSIQLNLKYSQTVYLTAVKVTLIFQRVLITRADNLSVKQAEYWKEFFKTSWSEPSTVACGISIWLYMIYHSLFNFFASTFPQADNLLNNSFEDDFTVSCSNSNVDQMAETLTIHSSNIEDWMDEQDLTISALRSTITLLTSQFMQSNTHPQIIQNNSLLPFERSPSVGTRSDLRPSLKI